MPTPNYGVILGMDWLISCEPEIEFAKYSVRLGGNVRMQAVSDQPVRVDVCSLKSLCKTVRSEKAVAWFGLLREVEDMPVVRDPKLDELCSR